VSGRRATALFVVASVLLGGTFVAAKAGLDYFPPLLFVALRFDIAAVVLGVYAVATTPAGERLPRTRGDVLGILSTGVLAIGLTNALLFVGQGSTTSGIAAIVFSLNPVLTSAIAAVVLADERLSARGALGLLLGLVGVGMVVSPDPASLLSGSAGRAIVLAGAATGAVGSVGIRWADGTLSSTARTAWGLPLAAALTHGLSVAMGESAGEVTLTGEALLALGFVGVFAGAVAYVAYFGLIDLAGAVRANLVFYVVPLVATVGGAVVLGESIAPSALGGFLVVALGFGVIVSESVSAPPLPARVRELFDRTDALRRGRRAFDVLGDELPTVSVGSDTTTGGDADRRDDPGRRCESPASEAD
jgi:drug/metabolite transporter (DMT)-like permease